MNQNEQLDIELLRRQITLLDLQTKQLSKLRESIDQLRNLGNDMFEKSHGYRVAADFSPHGKETLQELHNDTAVIASILMSTASDIEALLNDSSGD